MFCFKCGAQVEQGSTFCSVCGSDPRGANQPQPQQPAAPPPQQQYQQPAAPPPQQQYQQPAAPPPQQQYQQPAAPPPPQQQYQQPVAPPPQQQYQQPQQQYQPQYAPAQPVPHYAPGGFAERFHLTGASMLFMIAIILFSAGTVLEVLMSFGAMSIFTLMIVALPITGFWLIFGASKSPKLPEKSLVSMTLFRVSLIVDLVFRSIATLMLLIVAIVLFAAAGELRSWGGDDLAGTFTTIAVFSLLGAAGVLVYAILFFKSATGVVARIRSNLMTNELRPIEDIERFTILTYIGVGFNVLIALLAIVLSTVIRGTIISMLRELPGFMSGIVESAVAPFMTDLGTVTFTSLLTMAAGAGIVICIVILNRFNDSLLGKGRPPM